MQRIFKRYYLSNYENNVFKDDFGMTLTGMMAALTEIQTRGDNMLKAVRNSLYLRSKHAR